VQNTVFSEQRPAVFKFLAQIEMMCDGNCITSPQLHGTRRLDNGGMAKRASILCPMEARWVRSFSST